ncbi:hypothetical protein JHK85_003836 [Glycine max]|nr:hypothetical protein JHK85_003836 [Glycine max]
MEALDEEIVIKFNWNRPWVGPYLESGQFHKQSLMKQKNFKLGAMFEHFKHQMPQFQNIPKLVREKICDNYGFESPLKAVCNVEQSLMKQKSLKLGAMLEHFKHRMPLHIVIIVELQMNLIVKHKKTLSVEEHISMLENDKRFVIQDVAWDLDRVVQLDLEEPKARLKRFDLMPALKIMLSDYFSISNGRYHPELLRRYPILKDLEANKIDVIEFQSIPKLVRGNICDNYGFEFPLKAVCNVEYL